MFKSLLIITLIIMIIIVLSIDNYKKNNNNIEPQITLTEIVSVVPPKYNIDLDFSSEEFNFSAGIKTIPLSESEKLQIKLEFDENAKILGKLIELERMLQRI